MSTTPRPLGLWSAIALVAGNMIGSGVFLLPASLAPYGGVSLAGWAITLAGALLEKHGGDSLDELLRNLQGYRRALEAY